jgi:hypothetical protein
MIVREDIKIKNKDFVRTYSDIHHYIERDGVEYEEAYDLKELAEERVYTETNIPIEEPEEESE